MPNETKHAEQRADLRVLQANERTLLAWIRTSLALMAFGFVVARIHVWMDQAPTNHIGLGPAWTGASFLLLGTLSNIAAAIRYVHIRRAILEGRAVVHGMSAILSLTFGLAVLGALLAAHVIMHE